MKIKKLVLLAFLTLLPLQNRPAHADLDLGSTRGVKAALAQNPAQKTWLTLRLASLFIDQADYHQALAYLDGLESDVHWNFWKNVLLAKAYLGLNAFHKAITLLENLPEPPDPEINPNQTFYLSLYRSALETKRKAFQKMGKDPSEIISLLAALFPEDYPDEVKKIGTVPLTTPKANSLLIQTYHAQAKNKEMLSVALPAEVTDWPLLLPERCRTLIALGDAYREEGKTKEALEAYSPVISLDCEIQWSVKALYWKAKLEGNLKKYEDALASYRLFIKKFPNHRLTDDAYYALWKIYSATYQTQKAHKAYQDLMNYGRGDMRAGLLWDKGYEAYKKGNFKKAVILFDQILSGSPSEDESTPQAAYWKARALEKQTPGKTKKEAATSLYQKIRSDFPFSFYALLASARLGVPLEIPPLTPSDPPIPLDPFSQEVISTVNLLNQKGERGPAQDLLDYYSQAQPEDVTSQRVLMAKKWMESGDYNQVLAIAFEHFGVGPSEGVRTKNDPLAFALYPLAFPQEVEKAAHTTSLAQGLVLGIMREESLFKKEVESRAGAVGVMQLLRQTALAQARFVNLAAYTSESLTNPEVNILLGSSFFKKMLDLYRQNIPLAIMAYNAGPGNVNKWRKKFGHLPLDEFIEEIPFAETRGYIKRVMRSVQVYGSLLQEKEFTHPFFSMQVR